MRLIYVSGCGPGHPAFEHFARFGTTAPTRVTSDAWATIDLGPAQAEIARMHRFILCHDAGAVADALRWGCTPVARRGDLGGTHTDVACYTDVRLVNEWIEVTPVFLNQ